MPGQTTSDKISTHQPTICHKFRWTTFNTQSQTCQCLSTDTSTTPPDVAPEISKTSDPTPKSLTADRLEALLHMQKTDPFHKRIFKSL